jgi:hypothetical protein
LDGPTLGWPSSARALRTSCPQTRSASSRTSAASTSRPTSRDPADRRGARPPARPVGLRVADRREDAVRPPRVGPPPVRAWRQAGPDQPDPPSCWARPRRWWGKGPEVPRTGGAGQGRHRPGQEARGHRQGGQGQGRGGEEGRRPRHESMGKMTGAIGETPAGVDDIGALDGALDVMDFAVPKIEVGRPRPPGRLDQALRRDAGPRGEAAPGGRGPRARRRPESNRCARLCRPLRSHSATAPEALTILGAGGALRRSSPVPTRDRRCGRPCGARRSAAVRPRRARSRTRRSSPRGARGWRPSGSG